MLTVENGEHLKERYPLIAFVGAPGSGKSKFLQAFTEITGAKPVDEPYTKNPFLERFYRTGKSGFDCQVAFLFDRFAEMRRSHGMLLSGSVAEDSTLEADAVMFENLYRTKYANEREKTEYERIWKHIASLVIQPDILVYLRTNNPEDITKRIIERGRKMEIEMLGRDPEYFANLVATFEEWSNNSLSKRKGTVIIETEKINVVKDPENAIKECCYMIRYMIEANHSLGLDGKGSDGSCLIIPDFLKIQGPKYLGQVSWESSRFNGT